MNWKLADAKNRFSEVVNRAITEGPQRVSRRNDVVIVLCEADYEKFIGKRQGFREYIKCGTDFEGLNLERDRSTMREVDL